MKTRFFALFFYIFIFINCEIKTRAAQELTCDDYDGGQRDPGSASTCFSLPLTNEPTGDGQKPYKCCYGEAINKNEIQVRGCHEISENNYNRLSEYIEEKKIEMDLQYFNLKCDYSCDDYDGGLRDPGNAEFCLNLPLTNEATGDGQKPYKCCYGEAINKNGIQVRGCHEISENNYNRLSEYIEEKKKEAELNNFDMICGYCADYDNNLEPNNEGLCQKLPLTNKPCEDGENPYKCCYYEYTTESGKKGKGCREISKKNYDGLNDYIDATKKSNQLTNLNINCYSESNSKYLQNYKKIIVSMLSLILLFL